jgi:hypothetical protein
MPKFSGTHDGEVVWSQEDTVVINCAQCEFPHVFPFPDQGWLNEFYGSEKLNYIDSNIRDYEWWKLVYESRLEHLYRLLGKEDQKSIIDVGSGPGLFLKFAIRMVGKPWEWSHLRLP